MLDGHFRSSIEKGLKPVGQNLKRTGISPDHLTALGVVMAGACAVAIGAGNLHLGLLFLVLAGVPDALDGAVAKASGTASPRGAFFDSVADRVSDALVFSGVAWYFATTRPGLLVMLPLAVLATALIISYERAKAEALGYNAKGGVMERAERLILLGLGLLFEVLLIPVLVLMLVLTTLTVGQRFVKVWRQASVTRPQPARARRTPRPRRSTSSPSLTWRQRSATRRTRTER
jgi:CDP-diacylglycerol--glycerol-3-phosphate 3-phosphatidyltransferase